MTKLLEDRTANESIKESRAALRGMNMHVATILQHSELLADLATRKAGLLRDLADKLGDVVVMQYQQGSRVPVSVKKELHQIANDLLEGAAK